MVPPERAEAQPQQPQEAAAHAETPSLIFKYLLVGDAYTGKSTLLQRFATGEFSDHYKQTIGVDFSINTLKLASGEHVKLQVGTCLSLAGAATSIIFVATKVLSIQNTSFVATKVCFLRQTLVATKLYFVATKIWCLSRQKCYLWQLPPVILVCDSMSVFCVVWVK